MHELLHALDIKPRRDGYNRTSLLLPNGSRIIGLPGKLHKTIRGFSALSLLIFDEAAQVPDELYVALRPMLATTNGALWLLSTPYGKQGFFYNEWARGGDRWERIAVPATECPRISPAFLDEEREVLGHQYFAPGIHVPIPHHPRHDLRRSHHPLGRLTGHPAAAARRLLTGANHASELFIGLDLGQRRDPTAIAVIERSVHIADRPDPTTWARERTIRHQVRHLEILPLGTPYTAVTGAHRAPLPETASTWEPAPW